MRKILLLGALLVAPIVATAQIPSSGIQSNISNEVGIHDAQLMFFDHFMHIDDPDITAEEYFKRSLAYYPTTNTTNAEDYLMDSFLFMNVSLINRGWDGIYTEEIIDNYFDNFFVKQNLPIVREDNLNNGYAHMEKFRTSTLAFRFEVVANQTYKAEFNIKKSQASSPNTNIRYGVQLYDSAGELLTNDTASGCGFYCDPYVNMPSSSEPCFVCRNSFEVTSSNYLTNKLSFKYTIPNNPAIAYAKFIITNNNNNSDVDYDNPPIQWTGTGLDVDQFKLYKNNFDVLLSTWETDFTDFDANRAATNWEYHRIFTPSMKSLFEDRTPLATELFEAKQAVKSDIGNSITVPKTKMIIMLPHLKTTNVTNNYNAMADYFVNQLDQRFNTWRASLPSPIKPPTYDIEIGGVYLSNEDLRSTKLSAFRPFIERIRNQVPLDWKVIGSPFGLKDLNDCVNFGSSYTEGGNVTNGTFPANDLFDIIYQQPGAFFAINREINNVTVQIDVDRDILERAHLEIMEPYKLAVNIESRPFNFKGFNSDPLINEKYSRIQDNFDYAKKLGFINYSKIYYDTNGGNYLASLGDPNTRDRYDYDKLYEFIRTARKGHVVNGGFEELDDIIAPYNWDVPANHKVDNRFSTTQNRFTQFSATALKPEHHSDTIPVTPFEKVHISMRVKEVSNDLQNWSGLIGVRFFDKNNTEITTIATGGSNTNLWGYSTFLGAFYRSLNTSTTFQDEYVYFTIPWNAVKMTFFLKKNMNADVIYKDVKMHRDDINSEPEIFYTYPTEGLLQKEEPIDKGVHHLKLEYNQNAHTSERISINPGRDYVLKVDHKEVMSPDINSGTNKAIIGIKAYNLFGNAVTNPSYITGLYCCSSGVVNGLYYTYIDPITPNWNTFTSNTFQFSEDVSSIEVYLVNTYYNNAILLDNVSLEYADNNGFTPTKFPNNNKFEKNGWNEDFPLTANWREPVYYKDLIENNGNTDYTFSAWFKSDKLETDNSRILAVEYLDQDYNLLTDVDITSAQTGLSYSSIYRYWFPSDIDIDSQDCFDDDFEGVSGIWYKNQWEERIRTFSAPSEAAYMRISLQKLDDGSTLRILNPILTGPTGTIVGGDRSLSKSELLTVEDIIDDQLLRVFPNPTDQNITVEFKELQDSETVYSLYDVTGKLVLKGSINTKSTVISLENLTSGIYLLNVASSTLNITEKIIKK